MKIMIDNARVLLGQFARSAWREMYVRTPDGEIFIARQGGGANPMLRRAVQPAAPAAADAAVRSTITAPHVASVVSILPAGSAVQAGAVVTRLELLGEVIEITSAETGVVTELFASDGDFVEFDAPLLAITRAC